MAISRDATGIGGGYDNTGSVTQLSWNHTVGSGNPFLVVFFMAFRSGGSSVPFVTDISFNSASLTRIDATADNSAGNFYDTELWYLAAPATGTHSVVMNLSANIAGGEMRGQSFSYLGVDQISPIDSHNATSDVSNTNSAISASTTVVAANCWLGGLASLVNSGGGITLPSNKFDVEGGQTGSMYTDFADSNGVVGTGSQSILWTKSNDPIAGTFPFAGVFSLKPAVATGLSRTITLGTV